MGLKKENCHISLLLEGFLHLYSESCILRPRELKIDSFKKKSITLAVMVRFSSFFH